MVLCVFAVNEDKMKKNRIASCCIKSTKQILIIKVEKYYQFVKSLIFCYSKYNPQLVSEGSSSPIYATPEESALVPVDRTSAV